MREPVDFSKYDPFRRPEWRFERVLRMVDRIGSGPGRCSPRDDKYVRGLRDFILRYRNADEFNRQRLGYEHAALFWAYQMHERRDGETSRETMVMEARILARMNDDDICQNFCTLPGVVDWYEKLFFNVRDRIEAHDWIVNRVLIPSYMRSRVTPTDANPHPHHRVSEPFFDSMIKFFAYFGGPILLDFVLTGFRRGSRVNSREEIGTWLDAYYIDRLRDRSAKAISTFELSRYDVFKLFEVHNQIIGIERSVKNQEQAKDQVHTAIDAMITCMQWGVGSDGKKLITGKPLAKYDDLAVELRDEEQTQVSLGRENATIEEVAKMTMPVPADRNIVQEPAT